MTNNILTMLKAMNNLHINIAVYVNDDKWDSNTLYNTLTDNGIVFPDFTTIGYHDGVFTILTDCDFSSWLDTMA